MSTVTQHAHDALDCSPADADAAVAGAAYAYDLPACAADPHSGGGSGTAAAPKNLDPRSGEDDVLLLLGEEWAWLAAARRAQLRLLLADCRLAECGVKLEERQGAESSSRDGVGVGGGTDGGRAGCGLAAWRVAACTRGAGGGRGATASVRTGGAAGLTPAGAPVQFGEPAERRACASVADLCVSGLALLGVPSPARLLARSKLRWVKVICGLFWY